MSRKEEFLRRAYEGGILIDEVPALLQEIQTEEARKKSPKTNPNKFDNPRAQRLSDLWFSQRETATVEQKNRVGLVYISKVLGLGDEVAKRFAEGDYDAYHQVGMKQSGGEPYTPDLRSFWEEMGKLFPNTYTDENINFLVEKGGIKAVWQLQWHLEIQLAEESPVLRGLAVNAHVYK